MKKILNTTHLEGYLYDHDLQIRTTGENSKNPGTEYISGNLEIATDDEGLNVVPVSFRYVVEKTKAGKPNATYATLLNIINSNGRSFLDVKTDAMKLRVDTAIGINDFYNADNELITYKVNDGGFVHTTNAFGDNRNSFTVDILINGIAVKEEDIERNISEHLIVKGATFNFRGDLLPIDLVVKDKNGIKFFETLSPSSSEPIFMKVWGQVMNSTIETQTVEESAFGEPAVKISTRRLREWVITGASTEPYELGEGVLTPAEVKEATENRETMLAALKQRNEEYRASQGAVPTTAAKKDTDFSF